jgi:hypothetical protein
MFGTVNISGDIGTHLFLKVFSSRAVRVLYHRLCGTGHGDRLLVPPPPQPSQARTLIASVTRRGGGGVKFKNTFCSHVSGEISHSNWLMTITLEFFLNEINILGCFR